MKKKNSLAVAVLLIAAACTPKSNGYHTYDGLTQGTTYHIVVDSPDTTIARTIDSLLAVVDRSMSIYNDESLLSAVNAGLTDSLDNHLVQCILAAQKISEESQGAYDITVFPLVKAYGFGSDGATQNPNVDSLMQFVGYQKISIENGRLVRSCPGVKIDLNSIAQGYTSDLIAQEFARRNLTNYLIEVGGEIFSHGVNAEGQPWRIGIDSPREGNYSPGKDLQIKLSLSERGLATSGNYRKFYTDSLGRKIVHTVDPHTGRPVVSNLLSATVVAKDATAADAYGTLFMVIGYDATLKFLDSHPELDAFLVYDSLGTFCTYRTEGIKKATVE